MDFNDLLSFVQNVPMSAAQKAKYGLAQGDQALQGRALDSANSQFDKTLALQQAQQLWQQQMGTNQFNLQKAQQDWAQNHAGQEFDLEKAQQEWAQNQGAQDFALKQRLALASNDRAGAQQNSDLQDAASARNLNSIKASQMLQDYFTQMQKSRYPLKSFTRAGDMSNPYTPGAPFIEGVETAGTYQPAPMRLK